MKFRGIILLLGSILFGAVLFAQTSGSDELPSAPSAVQQERSKPKPPPPAAPPASVATTDLDTSLEPSRKPHSSGRVARREERIGSSEPCCAGQDRPGLEPAR